MTPLAPDLCPLCQQPNGCAMEWAKATGQAAPRCWCVDAVFTPALMAQIPEHAKGVSCVCARCAQRLSNPQPSGA